MGTRGRGALPYSRRNFCRTRFRQEHPPWCSPFSGAETVCQRRTRPSVYRTVDREHPTLIIDEADDLFYRKSDLRAIVNAGESWHEDSAAGALVRSILPENSLGIWEDEIAPHDSKSKYYSQNVAQKAR